MRFIRKSAWGRGAVPEMSLEMNALLTGYDAGLSGRGFIRHGKMRAFARSCIEHFNVKCGGPDASQEPVRW
ncbi:MAG: hypothetical protein R3E89_15365 [Thiolinea sp.]